MTEHAKNLIAPGELMIRVLSPSRAALHFVWEHLSAFSFELRNGKAPVAAIRPELTRPVDVSVDKLASLMERSGQTRPAHISDKAMGTDVYTMTVFIKDRPSEVDAGWFLKGVRDVLAEICDMARRMWPAWHNCRWTQDVLPMGIQGEVLAFVPPPLFIVLNNTNGGAE